MEHFNHILVEAYCTKTWKDSTGELPFPDYCKSHGKLATYDCLLHKCKFLDFTSCENTLCYIGESSDEVFGVSYGGDMEGLAPAKGIQEWEQIAAKKIQEAYEQFMGSAENLQDHASAVHSQNIPLPAGLLLRVPGLPSIESFSGNEYGVFCKQLHAVISAKLICNSKQIGLPTDDPRLIRLVNFLLFPAEEGLSYLRHRLLLEDEINQCLTCQAPMLDVHFNHTPFDVGIRTFAHTSRILICGDSYLSFTGYKDPEMIRAERFWPYASLLEPMAASHQISRSLIAPLDWGTGHWIDLLEYAGFYEELDALQK